MAVVARANPWMSAPRCAGCGAKKSRPAFHAYVSRLLFPQIVGIYTGRLRNGEKPADLSVQQSVKV